jgi:replicative DNA helicase
MESNDIQKVLLAALVNNSDTMGDVSDIIAGRKVFTGVYQKIWDALVKLYTAGEEFDIMCLAKEVGKGKASAEVLNLPIADTLGYRAPQYARVLVDINMRDELRRLGQNLIVEDTRATEAVLEEAQRKLFAISSFSLKRQYQSPAQIAPEVIESMRRAKAGEIHAVPSGLIDLDNVLGGFKDGDMVIIAGRPSQGKTALAKTILLNAVKAGFRGGFFSVEMSNRQIVIGLASALSGVDSFRAQHGKTDADEERRIFLALNELSSMPMFIDDSPINFIDMKARARKLKMEQKIDFLIIDYLQLIPGIQGGDGSDSDVASVSHMTKHIAKELNIPVIMLSQFNRDVERRAEGRPKFSDLRGSGAIEQDADVIIFVHGPIDDKSLIVAKHRNGPVHHEGIPVIFNQRLTLFQSKSPR